MACPVALKDIFSGEDGQGHFYLMDAPAGYDNFMKISVGGAFTNQEVWPWDLDPLKALVPGGYNAIVDLQGEAAGEYVFRYVTPATSGEEVNTPDDCEGCADCEDSTIMKIISGVDQEFTFCYQDTTTYNIFILAGVDPDLYIIDYAPGSPQSPNFDLFPGSPTYGNFRPSLIPVGVYVFDLDYVGGGTGCTDCDLQITIIIEDPNDPGDDGDASICI